MLRLHSGVQASAQIRPDMGPDRHLQPQHQPRTGKGPDVMTDLSDMVRDVKDSLLNVYTTVRFLLLNPGNLNTTVNCSAGFLQGSA